MIATEPLVDAVSATDSSQNGDGNNEAATFAHTTVPPRNVFLEHNRLNDAKLPHGSFPFMSLPRELRDKIYAYALEAKDQISVVYPRTSCVISMNVEEGLRGISTPALLYVSKQMSKEAMAVMYSKNKFHFRRATDLTLFQNQVRLENLEKVRNMHLEIEYGTGYQPEDILDLMNEWNASLQACWTTNINCLQVSGSDARDDYKLPIYLECDLDVAIIHFLQQVDGTPRLMLKGFREDLPGKENGLRSLFPEA